MALFTGSAGLGLLLAACAVLVVLPVQLVLCFRAKKLFVKLLPTAVLAAGMVTFYLMALTARSWVAFVYLIIAAFAGVWFIFGGIAWGIWSMIKWIKQKNGR